MPCEPTRGRRLLLAFGVFGAMALTGCADDGDVLGGIGLSTATVTALPTPSQMTAAAVAPEAARQLCDMIGAEIGNWRDQGKVIARVGFNATVQDWATRNDAINADVLRDKGIVDGVTSGACPDVRQRAIEVLGVEDLAGALLGFGR